MKVYRKMKIETNHFQVGDRIKFKFDGSKYSATAIQQQGDKMLFVFDQYLDDARRMKATNTTDGGYDASEMKQYLNELGNKFAQKMQKKYGVQLCKGYHGDYLWLLSLQEVCGLNEGFDACDGQIPYFKNRRHRIAERRGCSYEYMWLRSVATPVDFALVNNHGGASYSYAFNSLGVRPAFKILNRESTDHVPETEDGELNG